MTTPKYDRLEQALAGLDVSIDNLEATVRGLDAVHEGSLRDSLRRAIDILLDEAQAISEELEELA